MKHLIKKFAVLVAACLLTSHAFAEFGSPIHALLHDARNPIAGNPQGKITVVEFFDYQCSHCISMAPIIANIIQSNNNVRFVFKDFPIRGPLSEYAARAALAAAIQGKYYAFSHALLTTNNELTETSILNIAKQVGLNTTKLQHNMALDSIQTFLNANIELAQRLNIPGTPAFFVGPTDATDMNQLKYMPGEVTQSELQDAINASQ